MASKKKILFQLNYLYHLPAFEPIIDEFAMDKNYDVAITLTHDFDYKLGVFRKKKSNDYLLQFLSDNVRPAIENEIHDVVFVSDVIETSKYKDAHICMVYHGPTFNKTVTYRELLKHKDDKYLIFVESQYAADKLIEANCLGSSETCIVGYPKMDPIINNKFDRSEVLAQLGLDVSKKTILYAPTYKPTSLFELKDEIFTATKNYNLIIKLHHYSWMGKYASRNQSRIIQEQADRYSNSVLIPRDDYNILPLFAVADTLISEASGAITEFLITEKVGIIYNIEENAMKHSDDQPLLLRNKDFLQKSNIHINSPSQLKNAIDDAVKPSKAQLKEVIFDRDKYFNNCDGKASIRIKSIIDDIFSKETIKSPA